MKIFNLRNRKGSFLLICYFVIAAFVILGSSLLIRSFTEKNLAQREKESLQAFYLAQAGVMQAIFELGQNFNWSGTPTGEDVDLPLGEYQVSVEEFGEKRKIIATGFLPNVASFSARRSIEVYVEKKDLPDFFFDNALYVCGDATFNGNAFEVHGNVRHAGEIKGKLENIDGEITEDSSISPLARLSFAELRELSEGQDNIYDEFRLKTDVLPDSFWYDEAEGIPNIVYVESDLVLKGNIGDVGGFFVVVGDVISNPANTQDTTINGNGEIDGCIYTTGEFTVNGGGGGINVDGGVWAGIESTLNGNVNITYKAEYMNALRDLDLSTELQTLSWREL